MAGRLLQAGAGAAVLQAAAAAAARVTQSSTGRGKRAEAWGGCKSYALQASCVLGCIGECKQQVLFPCPRSHLHPAWPGPRMCRTCISQGRYCCPAPAAVASSPLLAGPPAFSAPSASSSAAAGTATRSSPRSSPRRHGTGTAGQPAGMHTRSRRVVPGTMAGQRLAALPGSSTMQQHQHQHGTMTMRLEAGPEAGPAILQLRQLQHTWMAACMLSCMMQDMRGSSSRRGRRGRGSDLGKGSAGASSRESPCPTLMLLSMTHQQGSATAVEPGPLQCRTAPAAAAAAWTGLRQGVCWALVTGPTGSCSSCW